MMEAVRTSETSVDNHFTRQYDPEENSEHHTHRRENLKSQSDIPVTTITDYEHDRFSMQARLDMFSSPLSP
jgi:3',5'-cyclic AMP phosphodiesterase CpdA